MSRTKSKPRDNKTQGWKEPADILICYAVWIEDGTVGVWGAAAMCPVTVGKRVQVRIDINQQGEYGTVTRLREAAAEPIAGFPYQFEYESDRARAERLKREAGES